MQTLFDRCHHSCCGFGDLVIFTGIDPGLVGQVAANTHTDGTGCQIVSRDTLLENAPEEYDGYFQVPKTLE